ncbi:MAG: hypothetical protein WAL12_11390 [Trebonia sp.]
MCGKLRSASGDVPAPGCSPRTTDTSVPDRDTPLRAVRLRFAHRAAEMLGPSPVAPFSIPVFRTGAADSLAEIRAAHPPPAG